MRTVLPVSVIYYSDAIVLAAWCELRQDFRHFRPDRMIDAHVLDERFEGHGKVLRQAWADVHLGAI